MWVQPVEILLLDSQYWKAAAKPLLSLGEQIDYFSTQALLALYWNLFCCLIATLTNRKICLERE